MIKRISQKNITLQNITSPFALSEFQISKGKGTLYHFQDATLIDAFIELRRDLDRFIAAQRILQTLLRSQPEGKSSPPLFRLLTSYLIALKESPSPKHYSISFICKLLRYEGLFALEHSEFPFPLQKDEWEALCTLAYATSHEAIISTPLPTQIEEKLSSIFSSAFCL